MVELPFHIIEHIAFESGIDARLALDVQPKKLDLTMLHNMNKLLKRKYETQYKHDTDMVTSLYVTNNLSDGLTKACTITHYKGEYFCMCHYTCRLVIDKEECYIYSDTFGKARGTVYSVDVFYPARSVMGTSDVLAMKLTPYNLAMIESTNLDLLVGV